MTDADFLVASARSFSAVCGVLYPGSGKDAVPCDVDSTRIPIRAVSKSDFDKIGENVDGVAIRTIKVIRLGKVKPEDFHC
jgi:hypothetical protein